MSTISDNVITKVQGAPADLIGADHLLLPGEALRSHNPANPQQTVWAGAPDVEHVDQAVNAAHRAFSTWARWPRERRFEALRTYQRLVAERADDIADLICLETGKTIWEAKQEASLLAGKVAVTTQEGEGSPLSRVTGYEVKLGASRVGRCMFRPHGVMAVIGPFNFPAHLPNGHIIPALAMGNTVVFKPSDKAPAVGQLLGAILIEALTGAGAPTGVVNVLHGGADIAQALTSHQGVAGVLFTGSWAVGRRLLEANLDTPGRLIALEMGGSNPAVVLDDANLKLAAIECVRASFATTGQRCTCTRRIIVQAGVADRFLDALCEMTKSIVVGEPRADDVFMGPIIREEAQREVVNFTQRLIASGAETLVEPGDLLNAPKGGGHYITPGVVRVDRFSHSLDVDGDPGCDVELFGPLVRVAVVKTLDEAIEQANATRYGLAASIFTRSEDASQRFALESRAGCVNINAGTAGASGKLPFGGLGLSGNHRPAGSMSLDYCAHPVASVIERGDSTPLSPGMRFDDAWL